MTLPIAHGRCPPFGQRKNVAHLLEKNTMGNVDHNHHVVHGCRPPENEVLSGGATGQAPAMSRETYRMRNSIRAGFSRRLAGGDALGFEGCLVEHPPPRHKKASSCVVPPRRARAVSLPPASPWPSRGLRAGFCRGFRQRSAQGYAGPTPPLVFPRTPYRIRARV